MKFKIALFIVVLFFAVTSWYLYYKNNEIEVRDAWNIIQHHPTIYGAQFDNDGPIPMNYEFIEKNYLWSGTKEKWEARFKKAGAHVDSK